MIFITGSSGFVGRRLIQRLIKKGPVVGLDILPNFTEKPISEDHKLTLIEGSTMDAELLRKTFDIYRPKKVIHMGMVSTPKETLNNPERARQSIVDGTLNLFKLADEFRCESFIHFSSSHVYGDAKENDFKEGVELRPKSLYGKIKKEAEETLRDSSINSKMRVHIVRPTSLYGPNDSAQRVVSLFVRKAIKGDPFIVKDTTSRMDFTYIEDFLDGLESLIESNTSENLTLNLSRGNGRTLLELAQIIKNIIPQASYSCEENLEFTKKGQLDISLAKQLIGFNPKVDLEEGIKQIIEIEQLQKGLL